jgi:hypothetical protein
MHCARRRFEGLVMWREARGLERALREREDYRNG